MDTKRYKLRFLPLFEDDLNEAVDYIAIRLKNPTASESGSNIPGSVVSGVFLSFRPSVPRFGRILYLLGVFITFRVLGICTAGLIPGGCVIWARLKGVLLQKTAEFGESLRGMAE